VANGKWMSVIISVVFAIILIIVIATGLFNGWMFIGLVFMGLLYLFGYLYLINHYKAMKEEDEREKASKKKLDWCWDRVNEMLKRRPDGQGLEWRRGIGRRSEYRTYYDGIQHRAFRSMEGYLAETQQIVVVIYDIDNDDIVRYVANPSEEMISNHFHDFKPVSRRESSGFGYPSKYGRSKYDRYRRGRGVNIHVGGDEDFDDFDKFNTSYKPDEGTADKAMKLLGEEDEK